MTTRRSLRAIPNPGLPRPLPVLYLIDSLGPGGAERLMVDLLPHLREHGVGPSVIAIQERQGNPVADELRSVGVDVTTIGIERLRERGALERVIDAVETIRPRVVHTQLEFSNILGSIAAHRLGLPSIATIHTLDRPRPFSRDAARFRLMAWTLRHRADRVIAVSESARKHVLARAGLRKKQTATIHNGIDLSAFAADRTADGVALRERFGIPDGVPVVTTVAILRQPKGVGDMLEALPSILSEHPDLVYLIAGDGEHRDVLEAAARRLGIDQSVRFIGRTSDVPAVLAASDAFVLPSHTEALPTVVIEAMAAGLPVIATTVGGIPELVDHGTTGILVPARAPRRLADAAVRLFASPHQATAMGIAGRRAALDRFGIDRQAARLVDEYRVLTAQPEMAR